MDSLNSNLTPKTTKLAPSLLYTGLLGRVGRAGQGQVGVSGLAKLIRQKQLLAIYRVDLVLCGNQSFFSTAGPKLLHRKG